MSDRNVWDILNRNVFFVKNAVRELEAKTSDKLDIYDPESRQMLLECREPNIGGLTKVARLFGGKHDVGAEFDLVASIPENQQQVLRVTRGSATLSLGAPALKIFDSWNLPIGRLEKKFFSLGQKYGFVPDKLGEIFLLNAKRQTFGGCRFFCGDKMVAKISGSNDGFYKEGKFDYAFYIDDELPPNSQIRQVLLAVGLAQHRMNL